MAILNRYKDTFNDLIYSSDVEFSDRLKPIDKGLYKCAQVWKQSNETFREELFGQKYLKQVIIAGT